MPRPASTYSYAPYSQPQSYPPNQFQQYNPSPFHHTQLGSGVQQKMYVLVLTGPALHLPQLPKLYLILRDYTALSKFYARKGEICAIYAKMEDAENAKSLVQQAAMKMIFPCDIDILQWDPRENLKSGFYEGQFFEGQLMTNVILRNEIRNWCRINLVFGFESKREKKSNMKEKIEKDKTSKKKKKKKSKDESKKLKINNQQSDEKVEILSLQFDMKKNTKNSNYNNIGLPEINNEHEQNLITNTEVKNKKHDLLGKRKQMETEKEKKLALKRRKQMIKRNMDLWEHNQKMGDQGSEVKPVQTLKLITPTNFQNKTTQSKIVNKNSDIDSKNFKPKTDGGILTLKLSEPSESKNNRTNEFSSVPLLKLNFLSSANPKPDEKTEKISTLKLTNASAETPILKITEKGIKKTDEKKTVEDSNLKNNSSLNKQIIKPQRVKFSSGLLAKTPSHSISSSKRNSLNSKKSKVTFYNSDDEAQETNLLRDHLDDFGEFLKSEGGQSGYLCPVCNIRVRSEFDMMMHQFYDNAHKLNLFTQIGAIL